MLYIVATQDTNGIRRLVPNGKNLTAAEADNLIMEIEARQTKPHKMDYFKFDYLPGELSLVLTRENILY